MYIGLHVKYSLFLSDFIELAFPDRFSKHTQISDFMKIRPLGAELFHEDGQTDITSLIVAFLNFANAPKYAWSCTYHPPPDFVKHCLIQHRDNILHILMQVK